MTDWFTCLGKPIPQRNIDTCAELLAEAFKDNISEEASFAAFQIRLVTVASFIRHDKPEEAIKTMRRIVGTDETLVIRALAVLCTAHLQTDAPAITVMVPIYVVDPQDGTSDEERKIRVASAVENVIENSSARDAFIEALDAQGFTYDGHGMPAAI